MIQFVLLPLCTYGIYYWTHISFLSSSSQEHAGNQDFVFSSRPMGSGMEV
jgi:hypothetical protein